MSEHLTAAHSRHHVVIIAARGVGGELCAGAGSQRRARSVAICPCRRTGA